MKKGLLKTLAICSVATLMGVTGCSALGGIKACIGNAVGCGFEQAGCVAGCALYLNPLYCLWGNDSSMFDGKSDCGDCFENCLVAPFFCGADCAQNNCANGTSSDTIMIANDNVGQTASYNDENGSGLYCSVTVDASNIKKDNATLNGEFIKYTATITVNIKGNCKIENAYLVMHKFSVEHESINTITQIGFEKNVYVGAIKSGKECSATLTVYSKKYADLNFTNATWKLYGTVVEN